MPAPNIVYITINFDSHINKVAYAAAEWTASGQTQQTGIVDGSTGVFTVTLSSGYVLDTVTLGSDFSEATLSAKTDTSFSLLFGNSSGGTITITSKQVTPKVNIDLPTLSGYESLSAGNYAIGVKAKASGYQDSDLSSTVSFTKLAAPIVTAADTTVTWEAITNADSYDVYVDGELYENTTGGGITEYAATVKVLDSCYADNCPIKLYDGSDANGTLLTTINQNPSVGEVGTFSIKSGSLYIQTNGVGGSPEWYNVYVTDATNKIIGDTTGTTVVPISSNVIVEFSAQYCLTADMMVTLADGSEKQICNLTSDDMYVAYDLATGDLVTAPAKHFDAVNGHSGKFAGQYQKYTFEDGTVIKEVHKHRFLNLTRMEFINLCHWEIGDRIYKIDGTTPALVSKEIVTERVEHFTVTTEKYHNGFVQGCLYGDRYTQRYEIQMVDGKPKYDFSKPHVVDYLYGELSYDD